MPYHQVFALGRVIAPEGVWVTQITAVVVCLRLWAFCPFIVQLHDPPSTLIPPVVVVVGGSLHAVVVWVPI